MTELGDPVQLIIIAGGSCLLPPLPMARTSIQEGLAEPCEAQPGL